MRYDNQVLYDKGFTSLAYQLEAMHDKATELEDDLDNVATIVLNLIDDLTIDHEEEISRAYDEGYSDSEWENSNSADDAYNDGFEDGKADGYNEGYNEGYEEGKEEGFEEGMLATH